MERLNEIETRKAEILGELENENADLEAIKAELDALEEEERSLNEQIEAENRKAQEEAEERRENADKIENRELRANPIEEVKMENIEIRNTKEYIDAYAEYIKTGNDKEVRSLLTENGNGYVAVPELVYDIVKTNWEKNGILNLIKKTYIKGNLKTQFEVAGTSAELHLEGAEEVSEEDLVDGIVSIVPQSFKKWIGVSDEVYDLRGEEFLRYVYDEIAYRIYKIVRAYVLNAIKTLPATATTTSPSANNVAVAPAMGTIATLIANLSDEAENPVIVMNKLTYADFKAVQYANGYGADPFEGLQVFFDDTLPAYSTATSGAQWIIVGDFGHGALLNLPNGEEVQIKFDDMTLMTSDMIRVMGRMFVGIGIVADKAFAVGTKA